MSVLVCANCWKFIYECQCSDIDKETIELDTDIADIVIELNRIFIQLQWDIRTLYSCSGHLSYIHIGYGFIMFAGNPQYFKYLLQNYKVLKKELKLYNMVSKAEVSKYDDVIRLCIAYDHNMLDSDITLEDKLTFLYGRCVFLKFWIEKIKSLKSLIK